MACVLVSRRGYGKPRALVAGVRQANTPQGYWRLAVPDIAPGGAGYWADALDMGYGGKIVIEIEIEIVIDRRAFSAVPEYRLADARRILG